MSYWRMIGKRCNQMAQGRGLKYELQTLPEITTPTGYLPPLGNTDHLPFRVVRTGTGNLPVYSDIKNGGTRKLTVIRKILGDEKELISELRVLLGKDVKITRKVGRIEVHGYHLRNVKLYLQRLGF